MTQIVLGGAVAAAIAPGRHRRAALLAGAALGTVPDLDVIPVNLLLDDPIDRMTWHRGPSHSLFVLPFIAWLIWAFFKRQGGRVAEAPRRWWWATSCRSADRARSPERPHRWSGAAPVRRCRRPAERRRGEDGAKAVLLYGRETLAANAAGGKVYNRVIAPNHAAAT